MKQLLCIVFFLFASISLADATDDALLKAHNDARAQHGLQPYRLQSQLDKAANEHAKWMAGHNRLTHLYRYKDGRTWVQSTPRKRISATNYQWTACGENIAGDWKDRQGGIHPSSPDDTVSSWLKSPGHRKAVLSGTYTEVGFGMAQGRDGYRYWCATYGQPKVPSVMVEQAAKQPVYMAEVPASIRQWIRNPDGSCVQCSGVLHGIIMNDPVTYTLLWDSIYGPAERGGSYPSRVANYARKRGMKIYNVTGPTTFDWLKWCAKTNRLGTPMGAGTAHFQSLYGWDPNTDTFYVCNNNSPQKIDRYSWSAFQRLHRASGYWIWVLDKQAPPVCPQYVQWWTALSTDSHFSQGG